MSTPKEASPGSRDAAPQATARQLILKSVPTNQFACAVGAIVVAAYVAVFVHYSPALPLQDFPNHLARAVVMADLIFHQGAGFGEVFQYRFLAVPYVLGDLMLASAVELLGVTGATALWSALVLLSLPAALLFYLRVNRAPANGRALAFLLSMYLSTDWFFIMGFLEFRLAVAVTLVSLALAELLRRCWSAGIYVVYSVVVVLGYLIHFTSIVFVVAALGVSALLKLRLRTTSLRREIAVLAPVGAVLAWHFGVAVGYRVPSDIPSEILDWGTVSGKIEGLVAPFVRFSMPADFLMVLVLAACVLWPARRDFTRTCLLQAAVIEMLVLAATFLVMYFVLPVGYADAWAVDVRALAPATVFLIAACLYLPDAARGSTAALVLPLAALLAIGNLAYLTKHIADDHAWLGAYRAVVAAVPRSAPVLPIYTHHRQGAVAPFLHAGSFVVIDRGGVIPYLFSGDRGSPMKYFRYVHRRYEPDEEWYTVPQPVPVDWEAVACDYDFLLVMRPFDPGRIRVPTTTVTENGSAALLAIAKQACTRPRLAARTGDSPGAGSAPQL
jgi:hypothetical protein